MRLRLLATAVLAGLLLLTGCTDSGASQAPDLIQVFPADDRAAAPTLSGELVDGSGDYDPASHADKVLVVNFWGSWCGPCVGEAPELESVYAEHRDSGVEFLGINVRDHIDAARAFARQHTTFPSIVDKSSRLALGFAVQPNAVPVTIVLDREGRIAAIARGPVIASELSPVVAAIAEETS